jgi:hypothetical protein
MVDDAELLRRLKLLIADHEQERERVTMRRWFCAAHNEGLACCVDHIAEIGADREDPSELS